MCGLSSDFDIWVEDADEMSFLQRIYGGDSARAMWMGHAKESNLDGLGHLGEDTVRLLRGTTPVEGRSGLVCERYFPSPAEG